ncbi:MAG: hypothetical protein ACYDAB_05415 [bacterium]
MTYFAVFRQPGPAWDASRPMRGQDRWEAHAAFMDGLAVEGFIVLGGPLGDGSEFLMVVNAENEAAAEARFAEDPWVPMRLLRIDRIEPWQILLGRLPADSPAGHET